MVSWPEEAVITAVDPVVADKDNHLANRWGLACKALVYPVFEQTSLTQKAVVSWCTVHIQMINHTEVKFNLILHMGLVADLVVRIEACRRKLNMGPNLTMLWVGLSKDRIMASVE